MQCDPIPPKGVLDMRQIRLHFFTFLAWLVLAASLGVSGCGISLGNLFTDSSPGIASQANASAEGQLARDKEQAADAVVRVVDSSGRVLAHTASANAQPRMQGQDLMFGTGGRSTGQALHDLQQAVQPIEPAVQNTKSDYKPINASVPGTKQTSRPAQVPAKPKSAPAARSNVNVAKVVLKAGGNANEVYLDCNRPYALIWNPELHRAGIEERGYVTQQETFLKATSPKELIVFAGNSQEVLKPGWVAEIPSELVNGDQIKTVITLLAH
jgi:hypothetical protein